MEHKPQAVFFLSCSGAGKSTLRQLLVEKLKATYVCNDEVRLLIDALPKHLRGSVQLKDIVARTWERIMAEAPNKFVVFDNNIIQYYMHPDSYINVAKERGMPVFTIGIEVPEAELRDRIIRRGINVEAILALLPDQLVAREKAVKDLVADFTIQGTPDEATLTALLDALATAQHLSE